MPTLQKIKDFEGHRSAIYNLSPSPRTGHFLSAGSEGILVEWDLSTGDGIALAQTDAPIYTLEYLAEAKLIILGLSTGLIVFVDSQNNKVLKSVQAHQKGIFDFKVFPDRSHGIASSEDGMISIWDLEKLELLHVQSLSPKSIRTLSFHPQKEEIVVGSSDKRIRVLDFGLEEQLSWQAHQFSVFRVAFLQKTGELLSVGRDAHLATWDPQNGYSKLQHLAAHLYAINDICQHPEGEIFFTGSMDKSIKIWDSSNLALLKVIDFTRNQCHQNGINRLIWTEGYLFSCGDDRKIMQWALT